MPIVVTGGTGFVGQVLVQHLIAHHRETIVLSRHDRPGSGAVEFRRADLLDPASLDRALAGADTVVHLAAVLPASRHPDEATLALNVDGTRHLALAAVRAGVRRLVYCSSAGVYGDGDGVRSLPHVEGDPVRPVTAYERSKWMAEVALCGVVESSAMRWIILRPTGLYGPGGTVATALMRDIEARRVWVHGPTRVIVHPTYVGDVVHAVAAAIDRPHVSGEVINIGGERVFDYPDYIATVAGMLGTRVMQFRPPAAPLRAGARAAAGIIRWAGAAVPPPLARLERIVTNRSVDVEKARRLLSFTPCGFDAAWAETIRARIPSASSRRET